MKYETRRWLYISGTCLLLTLLGVTVCVAVDRQIGTEDAPWGIIWGIAGGLMINLWANWPKPVSRKLND